MITERLGPEPGAWVEAVAAIEVEAFGEGGLNVWSLVPFGRHGRVFGLKDSGRIVAAAQVFRDWDDGSRAYLVGIAVAADRRGQGLGTRLLADIHGHLSAGGIVSLELTVDPRNTAAVRVYQDKLGYRTTAIRPDEYGPGQDRWVMEADLGSGPR